MVGTYNGEKYLREQLDSILLQNDVEVHIMVADDCSIDDTVNILQEYKRKYANFDYLINNANKNFTYNFLDLLFSVSDDYDYYAFSDQDDYWLGNKLNKAIEKIESTERKNSNGILYCSNLIVADSNLNKIGMQEDKSVFKCNKNTFFYENIATGCTIVFDNVFKRHATKYYPHGIKLHDYWLFLIAAYSADYVYDFNAYILYRQHGDNQIGTNKKKWTWKNIKKFIKFKGGQSKLAEELLIGYGEELNEEDRRKFIYLRDYKKKLSYKIKLMFSQKFRKRNHNVILKMKLLFNKI